MRFRTIARVLIAGSAVIAFHSVSAQMDTSYCKPGDPAQGARRMAAAVTFVGGNAGLFLYFKHAWWSGERAPHFFFHADWDQEFRDQDKFGHMWGGYHLARIGDALLRGSCFSEPKAITLAAAYATLFQLQIEIWDGHFTKYGFSYADLLANTAGTALAVAQYRNPRLRAIKPTISYWPSSTMRNASHIPGSTAKELRPSLDYAGQTYWFSTDVHDLLPDHSKPYWPAFLRFSVGHSVTDWVNGTTGQTIRGQRKILLSIDFDADKLPGSNPIWMRLKNTLSYIRFPAPALQLTPKTELIGLYR